MHLDLVHDPVGLLGRDVVRARAARDALGEPALLEALERLLNEVEVVRREGDEVNKLVRRAAGDRAEEARRGRRGVDDGHPARLDRGREVKRGAVGRAGRGEAEVADAGQGH